MTSALFVRGTPKLARAALAFLLARTARLFVAGANALVTAAGRMDGAQAPILSDLSKELAAANAETERHKTAPDDVFNAAVDRGAEVVDRIYHAPAHTLEGLRIKAEAFLWLNSGDVGWGLEEKGPTDRKFAHSLARDLLAMRPATR